MKLIEVRGTEYEMGYEIGKYFKSYLRETIKKYDIKIKVPNVYKKVKQLEKKLKEQYPKCLEEIYGRADGAGISRDSTLLMFFPEIFKKIDGCTTLIMKNKDGDFLFSHNEDDRNYNVDNIVLVKYTYDDYWIIGYTMAEKLTGSSFTFNSYGMIFSSNYIYDTKIDLNNISRYIVVRDIMNSSNVREVVKKLKDSYVASAFSLNILDLNKNMAINIEKDIKEIYITNIEDRYARANHFIAKQQDLPDKPISSEFRYNKSRELINKLSQKNVTINDLISILNYETHDYYKSIFKSPKKYNDKSITVANFSYDAVSNEIIIKDYLDNSEFKFNLKEVILYSV